MSVLDELLDQAKSIRMTDAEQRAQRLDFAYGNLAASTRHKPRRGAFYHVARSIGMSALEFMGWAEGREWDETRRAAVLVIRRPSDGRYLVVWNRRYGGWSFPGGRVEDSDYSELAAACRELREETGCYLTADGPKPELIYCGPHGVAVDSTRGSVVHVFGASYGSLVGIPGEMEVGCPVTWLTREEFMKWSPFANFYETVFAEWRVP